MHNTLERFLDGTFLFLLLPLFMFLILYGVRVRWQETLAGRLIFTIACGLLVSFTISVSVIVFPEWAVSTAGYTVRITARFILGSIFWYCLWLFIRTWRRDPRQVDDLHVH